MAEMTLIDALSAIQDNIEQPKKDASNPMFKSSYVTLDAVQEAIFNAKKKAKVSVLINNEVDDGYMYTLCQGYGEKLRFKGSRVAEGLGNRGTNAAQAEGSALTYARRYSLSMAFGITSDVDDDGEGVGNSKKFQQQNKERTNQQPNKISKKQVEELDLLIQKAEKLAGQELLGIFLNKIRVSKLSDITENVFGSAMKEANKFVARGEEISSSKLQKSEAGVPEEEQA